MRGLIPEDTLAELRDRAPIVEVVSAHVSLRRVGRNHVGLCPFHAEKSPSFTVNEDRGIFHCFGCGVGGNVFKFLMLIENLPFPEVVERLAERYGVTLPERADHDPGRQERESLFRLNEKTARFYQRYLWDAAQAEPARVYLEERGISRATADRYVLGFSPASGQALVRRIKDAGGNLVHAVKLGLVGERKSDGSHYDRFRGRVTFPITDSSGRVVGFGSRGIPGTASDAAGLPKYLNSPETPLYRKGAHCYGLSVARDAIRTTDRVLVVEGYFDVLALAEAGVPNAVASLGTALTIGQVQLLKRFTRNVVAFFDGDEAGQRAAEKSLPIFLEAGLWGQGAFLPAGDDPDTYVRREGAEAVNALVGRSTPLLEFYLDRTVRPDSTVAERAKVAQQIAKLLRLVSDPFEYEMTVQRAADRVGIPEAMLRQVGAPASTPARPAPERSRRPPEDHAPGPEEQLVTVMLQAPALALRVDEADALSRFRDDEWRALATAIVDAARAGREVDHAAMLGMVDEGRASRLAARLLEVPVADQVMARMVEDCVRALEAEEAKRKRAALVREARAAEAVGDDAAATESAGAIQEIRRDERRDRM